MIERINYLKKLNEWKNTQIIKVVTGIRRCGKSTLLLQFQEQLKRDGVNPSNIISINFEDLGYENLTHYQALYSYVINRQVSGEMTYLFLDEIQRVEGFEKAINSLCLMENIDIYLTGSNAFMLSGDLATLLSGRYIEIPLLPFSFYEYSNVYLNEERDSLFSKFIKTGGFPYITQLNDNLDMIDTYLEGIYNTIIVKDIEDRERRRALSDKRKVSDFSLLKSVARFLASSIGSPISIKSITDYIISSGRKVSQNTIADYIDMLQEAFIFYPVERYDIAGKQFMKMNQKFYIVDSGLRRYLLSNRNYDLGYVLENTVFLELLRRSYKVNIGKMHNTEVDFIARKNDVTIYIQVTSSLTEPTTFEREIKPLRMIKDNHPKFILTLDRFTAGNYEGIIVQNVVDWLLDG